MLKRTLMPLFLLASGLIAVGLGLRAVAQQAPVGTADTSAAAGASAPVAATPAAVPAAAPAVPAAPASTAAPPDTASTPTDDGELRQSADNNISFPVDI